MHQWQNNKKNTTIHYQFGILSTNHSYDCILSAKKNPGMQPLSCRFLWQQYHPANTALGIQGGRILQKDLKTNKRKSPKTPTNCLSGHKNQRKSYCGHQIYYLPLAAAGVQHLSFNFWLSLDPPPESMLAWTSSGCAQAPELFSV